MLTDGGQENAGFPDGLAQGRVFRDGHLLQIAMPMGGIGAGCVCLNGHGGLQDFSMRNKPSVTALPDGHGDTVETGFALLSILGEQRVTRLVEGPLPPEKLYDQALQAQGYRKGGSEGLPRFQSCEFRARYPFGEARLSDPAVPLRVSVTGWNPFIPGDDVASGLPCAILEYSFSNDTAEAVDFEFSFHASNPAIGAEGWPGTRNAPLPEGDGIKFFNTDGRFSETRGTGAMLAVGFQPRLKTMWFRGGWFDGLSILWREVSEGRFTENTRSGEGCKDRNGGSLLIGASLAPGESLTIPIVYAWHFPNAYLTQGTVAPVTAPNDESASALNVAPLWRPFYAGQWPDAAAVARYVAAHYPALRARTLGFADALYSSTLPAPVLDAVASNLAILKSPTVLRQENGNVWGWEGCFTGEGCCPGTCTHVWNYAQALPHLFPKLERTLREQELARSMDARGHVDFRAALPDGPTGHGYHAAADGQLGGIMKLYRDWQISGDLAWMRGLYPLAKRSLDFCIGAWDPDKIGALVEPHHNTYDIEFWGPDGMCGTIYLGALTALAQMAGALGLSDDQTAYGELAARAARFLDSRLYNGAYYQQHVRWTDLRDTSFTRSLAAGTLDPDTQALLEVEGPKYQYGSGCLSDGVIGAWMASLYGLDTPLEQGHIRSSLRAIFEHNFQRDLSTFACTQRPGYALGHEPGLVLCTWPRGGKPSLPFVYSDEVWTGIEYQVASHLICEGMTDEGLEIVAAVRSRYDGRVRNPFNEYECGSYYARAMASYSLLGALSGFRYSAVERTLWLAPRLAVRPLRVFFSCETGFGVVILSGSEARIEMTEGELAVERLRLETGGRSREIPCQVVARPGAAAQIELGESA